MTINVPLSQSSESILAEYSRTCSAKLAVVDGNILRVTFTGDVPEGVREKLRKYHFRSGPQDSLEIAHHAATEAYAREVMNGAYERP